MLGGHPDSQLGRPNRLPLPTFRLWRSVVSRATAVTRSHRLGFLRPPSRRHTYSGRRRRHPHSDIRPRPEPGTRSRHGHRSARFPAGSFPSDHPVRQTTVTCSSVLYVPPHGSIRWQLLRIGVVVGVAVATARIWSSSTLQLSHHHRAFSRAGHTATAASGSARRTLRGDPVRRRSFVKRNPGT